MRIAVCNSICVMALSPFLFFSFWIYRSHTVSRIYGVYVYIWSESAILFPAISEYMMIASDPPLFFLIIKNTQEIKIRLLISYL